MYGKTNIKVIYKQYLIHYQAIDKVHNKLVFINGHKHILQMNYHKKLMQNRLLLRYQIQFQDILKYLIGEIIIYAQILQQYQLLIEKYYAQFNFQISSMQIMIL